MGRVIHKTQFDVGDWVKVELPSLATILKVADQKGDGTTLTLWYEFYDHGHPNMREREFRIAGTGHDILGGRKEELLRYLDTVVTRNGELVWHVFMVIR